MLASMGTGAWFGGIARAVGRAVPWLLLLVVGLSVQAFQSTQKNLGSDVQFWLYAIGGALVVLGGLGIGDQIGREQTNEALRVKLETAFRRTARLYDRLNVVKSDVADASEMVRDAVQPKDLVPLHVVAHGLDVVAIRLEEQITTYDNALDEWHGLVPAEVERERARLKGQASFRD
jgi:hypothetical protein